MLNIVYVEYMKQNSKSDPFFRVFTLPTRVCFSYDSEAPFNHIEIQSLSNHASPLNKKFSRLHRFILFSSLNQHSSWGHTEPEATLKKTSLDCWVWLLCWVCDLDLTHHDWPSDSPSGIRTLFVPSCSTVLVVLFKLQIMFFFSYSLVWCSLHVSPDEPCWLT